MSDLRSFRPDPRPEPTPGGVGQKKSKNKWRGRTVATPEQWKKLRAKRLGPCYVCAWLGVEQKLESSLHHVVSKSLGGDDIARNLVPVCGDGTRGHHGDLEAHRPVACRALAGAIAMWDDQAYAYAVGKLGEDGFLRRYKVAFADIAAGDSASSNPVGPFTGDAT